jgi:trehalose 6-phosphate synthase
MEPGTADRARAAAEALGGRGLVVVSNRLPVERAEDGSWRPSSGGLVSALSPILEATGGRWVGWDGGETRGHAKLQRARVPGLGFELATVPLARAEVASFYHGFSNRTLWPLFHDLSRPPVLDDAWWESYVAVNRKFAEAAVRVARAGDAIWVHDYQLLLAPAMIRELRPSALVLFFLHIPFPPVELFRRLPWREQLVEGVVGADIVAFHTEAYAENFRRAALASAHGLGWSATGELVFGARRIGLAAQPISIDAAGLDELARGAEVEREATRIRARYPGRAIVLGVDRLDYTKGIPERLSAFEHLLDERPDLRRRVVLLQIAVPSRTRVREYRALKREVDELVGRINGRFTTPESPAIPVTYVYRSVGRARLAALYRAADVAIVTPLKDGMNLVAKEYVACRVDEGGVLVLSEFAGAARELEEATIVNPFDLRGTAAALARALEMSPAERTARMRRLRKRLFANDVFRWAERLLANAAASAEARRAHRRGVA